ncbi:hypothetical protein COX86_01985 [Candidatus Micrarchaeota archaeon CG_4_10_14_0_2_um_filter_60_11]|nr:MAG: hypothetical protein AUJ16_04540 [Candidatus Micrarchaeota archaeon CG1_02_60_51]PIN96386.1 MAG: hypothetical protein COU39_01400 [Candidatus Micrarchaeota archaeon CG10_big_fil_rev_8_21_14_0_10_60_32]PIO02134.1 MAG: hypothetical protein COT58_01550 [Candidatus Micrarchaeota archaeon CG09_land_8_20_14_0_10_60_16]PIY91801.1 MAG: hypothetical protein COY71_01215 [Candidatus Micrarchaeota archaeon CG_4_10_14_0_8_um_filter_60_7]PIZ90998.1 MAG: hypothetical protein COX86_01985 [Candidatus Mi
MTRRRELLLIGILLAFLLLFALAPRGSSEITRENAVALVSSDLQPLIDGGALVSFQSVSKSSSTVWTAEVRIVEDPYSRCPRVFKRYYTFSPFGYRPETIIDNCQVRPPIVYPEEALIAAGKDPLVAAMPQAKGCAVLLKDYRASDALAYCPWFAEEQFTSFVASLPDSAWVTQWVSGNAVTFVALDSNGAVLKKS